ncbi:MAG: hydrogenase maturation protease [Candidatus Marinimicrobia bacterium]|nr:hydrogenase maturation protease [Candidatus Neomarinimicrobiota bacterium]
MKTLILGLGNSILSDDGIGINIAHELEKIRPPLPAEIREGSVAGLSILDEIDGYDKVILIDSIKTGKNEPGSIYRLKPEDFNSTSQLSNSHGIDFFAALKFGEKFGYILPKTIDVYAVEVEDNTTFNERCTSKVEASVSKLVQEIVRSLR